MSPVEFGEALPVCWIGCLDGEARTLVRQVLDELGAS